MAFYCYFLCDQTFGMNKDLVIYVDTRKTGCLWKGCVHTHTGTRRAVMNVLFLTEKSQWKLLCGSTPAMENQISINLITKQVFVSTYPVPDTVLIEMWLSQNSFSTIRDKLWDGLVKLKHSSELENKVSVLFRCHLNHVMLNTETVREQFLHPSLQGIMVKK